MDCSKRGEKEGVRKQKEKGGEMYRILRIELRRKAEGDGEKQKERCKKVEGEREKGLEERMME